MKKLIKFILKLILSIVIIAGILVGGTVIAFNVCLIDKEDNTPQYILDMSDEEKAKTAEDLIKEKFDKSLAESAQKIASGDLENADVRFLFSLEEINKLFYSVTAPIKDIIPILTVNSVYMEMNKDNEISIQAPCRASYTIPVIKKDIEFKSRLQLNGNMSDEENTAIIITIDEIRVKKLTTQNKYVQKIITADMVKTLEDTVKSAGIEVSIVKEGNGIVATLTNISMCQTIVNCYGESDNVAIIALKTAMDNGVLDASKINISVNENDQTGIVISKSIFA